MYFYFKLWIIAGVIFNLIDRSLGKECEAPSKIGNFTFLSTPWESHMNVIYPKQKIVINCNTNKDATVTLQGAKAYTWEDVTTIKPALRLKRKGNKFIILVSAAAGIKYRCYATNKAALESETICQYVGIAFVSHTHRSITPVIVDRKPTRIEKNGDINITCEAQGAASVTYLKWKKLTSSGEVEIDKSKTVWREEDFNGKRYDILILIIKNAQESVKGEYKCVRKPPNGESTSASITIEFEKPSKPSVNIIPNERSMEVLEGIPLDLICDVSGSPKPTKSWFHNNDTKPLETCTGSSRECALLIPEPRYPKDSGKYSCVASNTEGEHTQYIDVSVLAPVRLLKVQDMNIYIVGYEESADFYCTVKRANPAPVMTWKFQHYSCISNSICQPEADKWIDLPTNSKYEIHPPSNQSTFESRLTISKSKTPAFYSCQAVNRAGNGKVLNMDVFNVTVIRIENPPPTFKVKPGNLSRNENTSSIITCEAAVNVYKSVTWLKDGKPFPHTGPRWIVSSEDTQSLRERKIRFSRLSLLDSGKYTCVGKKQRSGDTTMTLVLKVERKHIC